MNRRHEDIMDCGWLILFLGCVSVAIYVVRAWGWLV